MEKLVVIKKFETLKPIVNNPKITIKLRLLSVFGFNGSSVIFVTKDDNVFCYGNNRFGCLGLGVIDDDIPLPTPNLILSGKRLANIFSGFGHVIGLTEDGLCYGWGENDLGQLGIGSVEYPLPPELIELPKVVDICCGNRHTLALTIDGQVYSWGSNIFGQIAHQSRRFSWFPNPLAIKDRVHSICCGKCHSLALTARGQVYLWGLNEFGQLGRHRNDDLKEGRERPFCGTPKLIPGFENILVSKAVCGPNHTLLLTADGCVYSFGNNDKGQVGNGTFIHQYKPIKVLPKTKFKDIIAMFDNDLSIGVSMDNKCFVWGFLYFYEKIPTPKDISLSVKQFNYTLFDIFSEYSRLTKTYKTIVFEDIESLNQTSKVNSVKQLFFGKEFVDNACNETPIENNVSKLESFGLSLVPNINSTPKPDVVNVTESPDVTNPSMSGVVLLKHLWQSFNDSNNYDLKLIINEKAIHCHKTIIQIRNERVWQRCEQVLREQNCNEIQINGYSYEAFYEFVLFLYGMTPKVNDRTCYELLCLAEEYHELKLKYLCCHYMRSNVDIRNVCHYFDIAQRFGLNELKISCIDFATNNWKCLINTEEFQTLNETISKQFISLIIN